MINIIEESIDEAHLSQMYGSWVGNLSRITPPGVELEEELLDEEEEEEELEETSTMGGGAVEMGVGMRDEEQKLIREIEDYLFKTLGVDS